MVLSDWNDEQAARQQQYAAKTHFTHTKTDLSKQKTNQSYSLEKTLKYFPDAQARENELANILEARRKGSRNDSTADLLKALHFA